MAGPTIRGYLRAVGLDPGAPGAGDADLLARFAATGDEAAFEVLVWRHAPLVQRVCEQVLRDRHAAEDAAQATFLVLARRAGTFTGRGSVVGWLYRVARRIAVRLAKQQARLPVGADLTRVPAMASPEPADHAALWDEVARLPERYRVPVLLCFFEGLTHAEAARRTGLPVGTVAGQLARAKALLGRRLSRRGVAVPAVALPVAAGSFIGPTVQAATAFAAGRGTGNLVSPTVLQLTHGAMKTMTTTLLKSAAAALVAALGAATVWAVVPAAQPPAGPAQPAPAAPATGPVPKDAAKGAKDGERTADARQRFRSLNTLKQLMIAAHHYHEDHGHFPTDVAGKDGKPLLSWRVELLPYLEHDALAKEFKRDEPWDSEHNKALLAKMPKVFRTGFEENGSTKTYYQGFKWPGAAFESAAKVRLTDVTDGTSTTLGIVEAGAPVEWTRPADIAFDPNKPFPRVEGPFRNVVMVSMLDGAAYAFKSDLDGETWRAFVTRAGGEIVDLDQAKAGTAAAGGDKELAAKLHAENLEMAEKLTALATERQKLVAEMLKKPDGGETAVGDLAAHQEDLKRQLDALRVEVEALRNRSKRK